MKRWRKGIVLEQSFLILCPQRSASLEEWVAYAPSSYIDNYGKNIVLAEKRRDLRNTKDIGARFKVFREHHEWSQYEKWKAR